MSFCTVRVVIVVSALMLLLVIVVIRFGRVALRRRHCGAADVELRMERLLRRTEVGRVIVGRRSVVTVHPVGQRRGAVVTDARYLQVCEQIRLFRSDAFVVSSLPLRRRRTAPAVSMVVTLSPHTYRTKFV